jgi:hypothetical protein
VGSRLASPGAIDARRSLRVHRSVGERTLVAWWWLVPLLGSVFAAALIISRRPDVILHAQFWAEDGRVSYQGVYQHGLLATLVTPQSGYFQELPVLTAWLAQRLVPLTLAPLLMNSVAIAVRVLPAGLLLSQRARPIASDFRVRALLAGLYIATPGFPDTDGNVDNALWYLAVGAVVVLMLAPPKRPAVRLFDAAILVLCASTGVFSIALAPLAFVYRRARGAQVVPTSTLVILSLGATAQLFALAYLQFHVRGSVPRSSVPLDPTPALFFQILGSRVFFGSMFGTFSTLSVSTMVLIGILGLLAGVFAAQGGSPELRLMLAFGGAMLAMALAHPLDASWQDLTRYPYGDRYYVVPQFAALAAVVWCAIRSPTLIIRIAAIAVLAACAYTIPSQWRYPPLPTTRFAAQAAAFERSPRGTRMVFPLAPGPPWTMTLVKH